VLKFAIEQVMNAQRGVMLAVVLFLTSALDGRVVNATPRPLYPRDRDPAFIV
jgi:hypothetical protein